MMVRADWRWQTGAVLLGLVLAAAVPPAEGKSRAGQPSWRDSFPVEKAELVDHGRSPFFILEPGYRLFFENGKEKMIITVLDETRVVDGVKTRVVEERETKGGQLVEVSRNYFAINKTTGDAYYFGEEVDMYRNGKVTSHEGAWLAGTHGARFGLMIPGKPAAGDRFYQEIAPRIAMDRSEVVSVKATLQTPVGTFKNCLRTRESSALEGGSEEKVYAPEVGLIKDDKLVLVRVEKPKP